MALRYKNFIPLRLKVRVYWRHL